MTYSNSVRAKPRLRLLSAIVATLFAIRTLALCPLLFAINPSRIRTLRTTKFFHPSLATKNFRSISRVMTKILSLVELVTAYRIARDQSAAAPLHLGISIRLLVARFLSKQIGLALIARGWSPRCHAKRAGEICFWSFLRKRFAHYHVVNGPRDLCCRREPSKREPLHDCPPGCDPF